MRSFLSCIDSSAIPSSPSQLEWMLGLPGPTQKEACIPRCNSRIPWQLEKTTWLLCHRNMRPLSAIASPGKSHVLEALMIDFDIQMHSNFYSFTGNLCFLLLSYLKPNALFRPNLGDCFKKDCF